ncbi:MAG: PAS domain S-box protein [Psychrobium sp.]
MNQHSPTKSTTTLSVIFTVMVTVIVTTLSVFLTSKLYQQVNYLDDKWHEYRNVLVKKQEVNKSISNAFSEQGLLGDIRRYAFAPNKITENYIKSELESYNDTLVEYRNLQGLNVVETRLLMTVSEEITKLKNSFYLVVNFAAKGDAEKYAAIGDSLYASQGQEAIDKLTTLTNEQYQDDVQYINGVIQEIALLILASLVIVPLVVFLIIHHWRNRHKVSRDILAKHNRDELDKMYRHTSVPTLIVNRSGDIVSANAKACEMTGYSMNHILSKHLEQLVVKAPSGLLKQIMTLQSNQNSVHNTTKLITNKGDEFRVEIDITQVMDGSNLLSVVSFNDVERLKQRDERQDSINLMYDFSQDVNGIGSWHWEFGTDKLLWSPKTYEIYGLNNASEEISQDKLLSFIPSNEREDVSNAINEAVIFGNELNISHHIELANGEQLFVHQRGHVTSDESGKAIYMLGTIEIAEKDSEKAMMRDMSDRVFNSSLDAMAITNQRNTILKVNQAFVDMTGFTEEESVGQQLSSINRATFFDQCIYDKINKQVKEQHSWDGELWNVKKDGEVYPTNQHICALSFENDEISRYLCTFRDISDHKALEERIINSRAVDRVTMLPSRSVLQDRLNQSIKRHERDDHKSAVLVISIKPFLKDISEATHVAAIKVMAQRITQITRDHDTIARFGRHEFAVLLEGLNLAEDAYVVADKIKMKINQPLAINGTNIDPECAIGISLHPLHATSDEALIQYADAAMQQAKLDHNSSIQTFNQHILGIFNSEQHLNAQLKRAIDLKELAVNYQPVIDFANQQISRCIAHVRWHHRAYNTQDTKKFIASAKHGSLSKPLHDWLLENSIKYATLWSNSGLEKLELQVKLVNDQLQEPGLAEHIKDMLNTYQYSPEQLVLEVTYDTVQANEVALEEFKVLTEVGIKILVVNIPDDPQAFALLKSHHIAQAHTHRMPLSDPDLENGTAAECDRILGQIKDMEIYPSNFNWQKNTFVSQFKDASTRKQHNMLVCGSIDTQNLIVLGNKLLNTTT